jgi:hypothetical protein
VLDYWWVMCFTSYQLNWNSWIWIPFPIDSDCTLLCAQVDKTRYSSIASGNNCMSIIKHNVTKCSTETTLSRRPGASVVLSSSVTASAAFAAASTATATSSSSGHHEEYGCALPMIQSVFSWCVPTLRLVSSWRLPADVTIGLLWKKWLCSFRCVSMMLQMILDGNTVM